MAEHEWLAEQFEAKRTRLRAVAYRMLGSTSEADDAVQEAWLRLSRADTSGVDNLGGWLTTVVARVCLDALRSRQSRREEALDSDVLEQSMNGAPVGDAEHEMLLADSIGTAMFVVLETLDPAERVAFVLHDMFDLPFDEIASIVGRSPVAARQLASRARRRVRGASTVSDNDFTGHKEVVEAFLAASRRGDMSALLAVLDPSVVLRADRSAIEASAARLAKGAPALAAELRGASVVAETFAGRAKAAQPALLDGA
ncbi:MAG TPA: sigma-70 family RNA polymerase sigma factor, partial [Vicinamibacterales bacterium]